jgi:hypothetical protein
MIWTIDWGPAIRRDLLEIGYHQSERICRAVMHFAATGRGAEQHDGAPSRRRIRVQGAVVYLLLDPVEKVVHVTRAFRRV